MLNLQHRKIKRCGHLHVMLVIVYGYEQNPLRGEGGVAHTRFFPYMLYSKKMTKSNNSCKTCSIVRTEKCKSKYPPTILWRA